MKNKKLLLLFWLLITATFRTFATDTEPDNNSYTGADVLAENGSVSGSIDAGADNADWYQLITTNDGMINLSMTFDGYYIYVYLYDNDGTTYLNGAGGYGGATFGFNTSGLAAGTYYALVLRYGASPGNYTLSNAITTEAVANDIEPNGTLATALILTPESSTTGHINFRSNGGIYDTYDYYILTTDNDGTISLSLDLTGYFGYIYLFDNDGVTYLASASNYGGSPITINAGGLAAGTYTVIVQGYSTSPGSYTLSNSLITDGVANDIEPNNSVATALSFPLNSSTQGHINFRNNGGIYDSYDYYQLETDADGNLSFTMDFNGYYIYMNLFDADGTTYLNGAGNYGGAGPFSFTVNGLAAGTYYLQVQGYSTSPGGYTLTNSLTPAILTNDAEVNDTPAQAVPMMTNSSDEGHIKYRNNGGSYDDYDYYKLTTHNSGTISFTLNYEGYYVTLNVFSGDGVTYLSGAGNYGGIPITVNLGSRPAGDYYAVVTGYSASYGTYTLNNAYCPDAITIIAEGETTFCDGESVTLMTEDHHINYLWNDGSTTETNVVTLTGDNYLTIDDGGGCLRTSNTITTESTPLPVAIIEADGPTEFCEGGSVTLSVGIIADTYLWSTGETTPTITVSSTGNYDVMLTKNSCSAISDPIHIEVNPNPVAIITPDAPTTFCEGGSVLLNASPPGTYLWSDGSTGSSVMADTSANYSVTVTDANGCSDLSDETTVIVNPNPIAGIVADGPTTFCDGESVNLIASGGTSYLWSTGATSSTINVTTSGDYSVSAYSAEGCSDLSDVISVSANPCGGDLTIVAEGSVEFCDGGSVTLTSSEEFGNTWSTGETTQSIVVSSSGDFYCMNGENTSNTITVIVNANPDATIIPDGPTSFCSGGSVNLNAVAGYDNYLWSDGSMSSFLHVTTTGSYSVSITDNGCESTSSTVDVNVTTIPVISISSPSILICYEGSVDLTASTDGESVQWQHNGTNIPGATGTVYSATMNGKYTCIASNGTCSATSNTIKLSYAERAEVTPAGTVSLCGPDLTMSVPVFPGSTYQWYKNNVTIAGATSNSYTTAVPGKFYCLIYKDGCTRASKLLIVNDDCRMADEPKMDLTISPNPNTGSFTVEYSLATDGEITIMIIDMTGKIVMNVTKTLAAGKYMDSFHANNLASGIYMVTLIGQDENISEQKLVIEK